MIITKKTKLYAAAKLMIITKKTKLYAAALNAFIAGLFFLFAGLSFFINFNAWLSVLFLVGYLNDEIEDGEFAFNKSNKE